MNKKIYFFPIDIESCEEGGFLATCQTLQGCFAEGDTYGQAIENIQDIIKIQIKERQKHKDILPEISVPEKTELHLSFPLPVFA